MGAGARPFRTLQPFFDIMQDMRNPLVGVLLGAIFTAVVQSSAATLATVIAMAPESWQRHYRGAYFDSFLDGDVLADRLAVWHARLMAPSAAHFTVGAFQSDAVVGFVHMILDEDPHWGTLLDNLHVTYGLKRHGIGRRLLTEAARELVQRCPADRRFYLWVLAQNTAAQAFYAACGGARVETTLSGPFPGGGRAL